MNKKKLGWTLVFVLLAIGSIALVLAQADNFSLRELGSMLVHAHKGWLFLAALCMLGFIVFESEALLSILKQVGEKKNQAQGFLYSAADVYFSAITPSASGGQPASAYFMVKSGIHLSVATAVLLINLVMYTLAILTIGAVCIIVAPKIFFGFNMVSRVLIVTGYVIIFFLGLIFILLLTKADMLENWCKKLYRLLGRIHLMKNPEKRMEKLHNIMDEYRDCVAKIRGHKRALISAYLWNIAQRLSQIGVAVCMYMATNGNLKLACKLLITQCFVVIGSNCVPIPGGMGVADYLMIDGYHKLMLKADATKLELLSRGMAFYVCVIISGLTFVVGYIFYRRKRRKRLMELKAKRERKWASREELN